MAPSSTTPATRGVEVLATGWIDQRQNDFTAVQSAAWVRLGKDLAAAGIELAEPQYGLWVRQEPEEKAARRAAPAVAPPEEEEVPPRASPNRSSSHRQGPLLGRRASMSPIRPG